MSSLRLRVLDSIAPIDLSAYRHTFDNSVKLNFSVE